MDAVDKPLVNMPLAYKPPRKRLFHMKTPRLIFMMVLTFIIFVCELVSGYLTNSMALVADSFHMLSDVVALCVALASVRISKRQSPKNTFGWVRAEVLGGLVNSVFLMALCFSILVEAIKRIVVPEEVENIDMLLIVGGIGLAFNLIGLFLFRGGHGHSHGGHGHGHGDGAESKGHKHGHSHGSGKKSKRKHKQKSPEPSDDATNAHMPASVTSENEVASRLDVDDHAKEGVEAEGLLSQHAAAQVDVVDKLARATKRGAEEFTRPEGAFEVSQISNEPDSSSQLNMRGVFLHVFGDFLGSVIVIISGLAMKYIPEEHTWKLYLDPAMSILLVIIMVNTTRPLLQESAMILLQTVPTHIQVKDIKQRLENTPGVLSVHELHVWQLAGNRVIASVHIQCADPENYMVVAERVKNFFHNEGIHSTTVQPEFPDYDSNEEDCALPCAKECAPKTCCGNGVVKMPAATAVPDEQPPAESQHV